MLNDNHGHLDVQRLMHEIRAGVANQLDAAEVQNSPLPAPSNGHLNADNHYHVNDLLRFHGEDFVRNAYRALLRREPDEAGMAHHLAQLAAGRVNKMDVLASLHSSAEGRSSQVKLAGLSFPVAVRRLGRLPVLGYVVRLAVAVARLPLLIQYLNQFEFYTWSQQQSIGNKQDQHYKELRESLQQISAQMLEMMQRAVEQQQANELSSQQYEQLLAKLHEFEGAIVETRNLHAESKVSLQAEQLVNHQRLLEQLQQLSAELRTDVQPMLMSQQRAEVELLMQERRLTVLLEQLKRSPSSMVGSLLRETAAEEEEHLLDGLYAKLEDQFRGPREEVSRRLQVYLPVLKRAGINSGVLDIGCGRGEWLQLLRAEDIEATGVDRNRVFIEECRGAGLKVIEQDALVHLRGLDNESLNVVTIFHLVEHLQFDTLIKLLDEVVRTLRPNGLLIVETPNPENFMVGSYTFYADPTHRNPIPSQTLKFLLEARGLRTMEILKLRPWDEAKIVGEGELIQRFNEYFYSAPDYGVIAGKP